MHKTDKDTPAELLYTGNGNSLAALLALQSDHRFHVAARLTPENQSEPEYTKKGAEIQKPPARKSRKQPYAGARIS